MITITCIRNTKTLLKNHQFQVDRDRRWQTKTNWGSLRQSKAIEIRVTGKITFWDKQFTLSKLNKTLFVNYIRLYATVIKCKVCQIRSLKCFQIVFPVLPVSLKVGYCLGCSVALALTQNISLVHCTERAWHFGYKYLNRFFQAIWFDFTRRKRRYSWAFLNFM